MKKLYCVLFCVLLLMGTLVGSVAAAKPNLLLASGGAVTPKISGNYVVWQDYRDVPVSVHVYNIAAKTEMTISGTEVAFDPDVDEDRVLYNSPDGVHVWNATTGVNTLIGSAGGTAISGDYVVWKENRYVAESGRLAGMKTGDIFAYNLVSGQEMRITTSPDHDEYPEISGKYIVWMRLDTVKDPQYGDFDIYAYNLDTGEEISVCTRAGDQYYPAIDGSRVVWEDHRAGNYDIYLYDLNTRTERRITTSAGDECEPDISGDTIVWEDSRSGNLRIYAYNLKKQREYLVSTYRDPIPRIPSEEWEPRASFLATVSGDQVVWQEYPGGDGSIYLDTIRWSK